jgi:ribosomal protein L7/L12
MINVGMTIREMVSIASNPSCNGDLYERIIRALEVATGNTKFMVAYDGVSHSGKYWDNKIPAIKCLRLATGWGLKESKDWIEEGQYHTKTMFTGPLDPEVANKLVDELKNCGCKCWTVNA